jgi:hypothetical protein
MLRAVCIERYSLGKNFIAFYKAQGTTSSRALEIMLLSDT